MSAMSGGVGAPEVAQPAPVVLRVQRQALVLDPAVDAHHVVGHLLDGDARAEEVGREDHAPVREPDLAVLDAVLARLALLVLGAVGVVPRQTRGHLVVVVVVAKRAQRPNSPVVGSHWSMKDVVSNVLSSCDALTPSVLRLFASMTMYLNFVDSSPLSQKPVVYEPRKNSSEVSRSSTPSQ
jgi:hypothetical protein